MPLSWNVSMFMVMYMVVALLDFYFYICFFLVGVESSDLKMENMNWVW